MTLLSSRSALICIVLATITLSPYEILGYPEPAIVSPSWSLKFEFNEPRPIAVKTLKDTIQWYWYMPYEVVNLTGKDRLFIPEITIATDSGQIITAGRDVPPAVFNLIKEQLQNPLLESPIEIVGKILQGEDYAREGVAIWPAFGEDVDEFTVFFAGHSGENATVQNPVTKQNVLMRRTNLRRFSTPGNHPNPEAQPVILIEQTDVMR